MRVLVVNAGSSSLKLSVVADGASVAGRALERWEGGDVSDGVRGLLDESGDVDAVGHRVVHGGDHARAELVDDEVLAHIESWAAAAPLHNPPALRGIRAVSSALPELPAVACYDTAFHTSIPGFASTYAIPQGWDPEGVVRRYGFHGLSYAWASRRAAAMLGRDDARLVVAHLGSGASVAAVRDGRSVDTSMGFTPLEGLVMRTRAGSVDPGLLVWLLRRGLSLDDLDHGLWHSGGLAALSGTSGDMRDVLLAGTAQARLALDVFGHRLAQEVAAMAVSAGGLDALVLTGGIGENVAAVREDLAARLAHLGVALDADRNAALDLAAADMGMADIADDQSVVRVLVVAAREDLEVARQVAALVDTPGTLS